MYPTADGGWRVAGELLRPMVRPPRLTGTPATDAGCGVVRCDFPAAAIELASTR